MKKLLSLTPQNQHFRQLAIGILIILLARLAVATVVLLSRFAAQAIPMPMILFFQNGIAFLCVLPFLWKFGLRSLKTERLGLITVRIISGLLGFVFLLLAAQKISIVGAILLNNAGPLYVPFVAFLWRKVPINNKLWPGVVLGFVGLILFLQPWKILGAQAVSDLEIGFLFGFLSGVFQAIAMVSMRVLRFEKMFPVLFMYYIFATIVTLPTALIYWTAPSSSVYWMLPAIGVLTLITQGGYLKAFKYGKASHLSPFFYIAVVYGGLFDWIFFHHIPDLFMWLGVIFLCVGGILVILSSKPESEKH